MGLHIRSCLGGPFRVGTVHGIGKYFKPNGEPKADYESYREYL